MSPVKMSGRRALSNEQPMASHDHDHDHHHHHSSSKRKRGNREARSSPQPEPQLIPPQQYWQPPPHYPQYPGCRPGVPPYGTNYIPYLQQVATPYAPTRRDAFNPFDEEDQERLKKGKELVPLEPLMHGPIPWAAYPGYSPGAFGYPVNSLWPALPPPQPASLGPSPYVAEVGHDSRKTGRHVHHQHDRPPGLGPAHDAYSPEPEIRINRKIDGVLTPNSGDLTVHLTMDLQEDLGDYLDEFSRLSKLGHFLAAHDFFKENLGHHLDNPYVLIQYADMMLRQGNFKEVTILKDTPVFEGNQELPNSEVIRTLRINWELMQRLAKSYTLDSHSGVPDVFTQAAAVLGAQGIDDAHSIGSTELQILGLTLRLTGHPTVHSKWFEYASRALDALPTSLWQLYPILLRQGRIWDLHDLITLMPIVEDIRLLTHGIFKKDLIPSLQTMISEWQNSVDGHDSSTTLALLSIMTHIMLSPIQASEDDCVQILKLSLPLGSSIVENDLGKLKSRPYLRLLLAKSRFSETASRRAMESLTSHLESLPGLLYHPDIASLPIYVPSDDETPDWTPTDQPQEITDPVRLVLRSAIELGDYETEILARQELIRLSSDPRDHLNKICDLQLSRQGDLNGYSLSLASQYMVATTQQAKEDLRISISRLFPRVASYEYWNPSRLWVLGMMLSKLEGKSTSTIRRNFGRADHDYRFMDDSLLQEISRKIPTLKDWADFQIEDRPQARRRASHARVDTHHHSHRNRHRPRLAHRVDVPAPTRNARKSNGPTPEVAESPAKTEPGSLLSVSESGENPGEHSIPRARQHLGPRASPEVVSDSAELQVNDKQPKDVELELEAKIKKKVEAELSQRMEDEKKLGRKRQEERKRMMNEYKIQVDAARKEAREQAEKKARVEAQERMEQMKWEKQLEESRLQKDQNLEIEKAKAAAAELKLQLEATRKLALEEADKRLKEEIEWRKTVEAEAEEQAKAAEELEQLEAELRAKQKAEDKLREAELKYILEDERKKSIRKWAAERAERDIEQENQIHLRDAVGRRIAIPFSQGRTWKGMEELIQNAFLHIKEVGPDVLEGHFDLLGPDGAIILPQAWDDIIQPGWNISMQMWPKSQPMQMMPPPPPQRRPSKPKGYAAPHPPPPPPPPPDDIDDDSEEVVVIEEETEPPRGSSAKDDASSGYEISLDAKPSRRARIANAFSGLKSRISRMARRRRRASWPSTSSSYVSGSVPSEVSSLSTRSTRGRRYSRSSRR